MSENHRSNYEDGVQWGVHCFAWFCLFSKGGIMQEIENSEDIRIKRIENSEHGEVDLREYYYKILRLSKSPRLKDVACRTN